MFAWAEESVSACRILRDTFGEDLLGLVSAEEGSHEFNKLQCVGGRNDGGAHLFKADYRWMQTKYSKPSSEGVGVVCRCFNSTVIKKTPTDWLS